MSTNCILNNSNFPTNLYPRTKLDGKSIQVSHLVYMRTHNVTQESLKDKVIMHSCDNPRCINPEHLILGTQRDNVRDMWSKNRQGVKGMPGVKHPLAILKDSDVLEIRSNLFQSGKSLAIKYGVSVATISMIRSGKTWRHLLPSKNKLETGA